MNKIHKTTDQLLLEIQQLKDHISQLEDSKFKLVKTKTALKQSEDRYRSLVETIQEGMGIVDTEESFVFANSFLCKMLGYSQFELIGKNLKSLIPDDEFLKIEQETENRKKGISTEYEFKIRRKDGSLLDLKIFATPWLNAKKEFCGTIGLVSDVTAKKKIEESLLKSEERFRSVAQTAIDAIITIDDQGNIVFWNDAAERIFGYSAKQAIGQPLTFIIPQPFRKKHQQELQNVITTGKGNIIGKTIEFTGLRKDQQEIPIEISLARWAANDKTYFTAIIRDITFRKQAETALIDKEKRHRNILENLPLAIITLDQKGTVTSVNPAFTEIFEIYPENIINKQNIYSLSPFKDIKATPYFTSLLRDSQPFDFDSPLLILQSGKQLFLRCRGFQVITSDTKVHQYMLIISDITKRKIAEKTLAEEKKRLAVTLQSIADGVVTTDVYRRITSMNKMAETLTGWKNDAAVGKLLDQILDLKFQETQQQYSIPIKEVIDKYDVITSNSPLLLTTPEGKVTIISCKSAPIKDDDGNVFGIVFIFQDISEKQKIEAERLKSSKMESLGILAGGIAHDFNNILTAILNNASLAKLDLKSDDSNFDIFTDIEEAVQRAKQLTKQLLTFSRGGAPIKEESSIAELIKDSVRFVLRGSKNRCEFNIPENLWLVSVDKDQLSQVIQNVVINADQSMPDGGIIQIQVENCKINGEQISSLRPGNYIKIAIKDLGIGIPAEHLTKIFDPYFTTKKLGSGLGLAVVYSIITKHDGFIDVQSQLGIGTTVDIFLPVIAEKLSTPNIQSAPSSVKKGKILLRDDEELILKAGGKILQRLGFTVELARDGQEAIEMYKMALNLHKPFQAVIMDLTIPGGLGGQNTIPELLKIDLHVKAIVSSGYSNDPVMADYQKHGFKAVVCKPYRIEEMEKILTEVING